MLEDYFCDIPMPNSGQYRRWRLFSVHGEQKLPFTSHANVPDERKLPENV
jgi:hypothetical protein